MELTKSKTVRSLGVELTRICNFRCIHCYQKKENIFLNTIDISKIIEYAEKANIFHIYLTGGEALLHPKFNEIYLAFRKRGFFVSVFTNGSLMPKIIQKVLIEYPPHLFEVSIYGFSSQSYLETTGVNAYKQVLKTLVLMKKMKLNLLMKFILLTTTCKDIEKFLMFTRKNKIQSIFNSQIIPKLDGDCTTLKYRLSPQSLVKLCDKYGLTLFDDKSSICTAGLDLYINSNSEVQGCPVLITGNELKISDCHYKIACFVKNLNEKYGEKTCLYGECPAWQQLEDAGSRNNFLDSIKRDAT